MLRNSSLLSPFKPSPEILWSTDPFALIEGEKIGHIALADLAELIVIFPATANIIGKIANGIADDFLSTMVMASRAPVSVCLPP